MTWSVRSLLGTSFLWWLIAAGVALYFILPLKKHINFGIDLVGGTYIALEVQTDKAVENDLHARLQPLLHRLKKDDIVPSVKVEHNQARITFDTDAQARTAEQLITDSMQRAELKSSRDTSIITVSLPNAEVNRIKRDAVTSNIEVLRTRLDRFGVGEVTIAAQGENRIVIELPNVQNPQQAKAMIGKAAILEFKVVEDMGSSEEEILARHDGMLPEGSIIIPGKERLGTHEVFYLVPAFTDVTGKLLKDAHAGYKPDSADMVVFFSFKPEGAEKFGELTGSNLGKSLAIILDNQVISAPRVKVRIEGDGFVEGEFNAEQAKELAALLKSGAFVAPVKFAQEQHIGPSLGAESIRSGLVSCGVGLALLLLFSILAYKTSGVFAFFVLLYNLFFMICALAAVGATLTLPGIAGMVLTVGMAIDSSILIYERIRELLAVGTPMKKAVSEGFSNAMGVILDANITTFIAGLVLYKMGTGPIQGFAITIIIGIVSTLITGLFVLRSLFSFVLDVLGFHKVSI